MKKQDEELSAYAENPTAYRTAVRKQLRNAGARKKLRKALKSRAQRWALQKSGALPIIEEELRRAEEADRVVPQ